MIVICGFAITLFLLFALSLCVMRLCILTSVIPNMLKVICHEIIDVDNEEDHLDVMHIGGSSKGKVFLSSYQYSIYLHSLHIYTICINILIHI